MVAKPVFPHWTGSNDRQFGITVMDLRSVVRAGGFIGNLGVGLAWHGMAWREQSRAEFLSKP
jgi:hypothetical protein